ncbi:hypothetical protein HanIR_Chr17g0853911 [Helianthus annuus]|nr:hypothetical protein HanIR_Chr17g0853911 [Helianthus annuus]
MVHHQPTFDHAVLKGTTPLDPPERPYMHHHHAGMESKMYQL